MKLEQIKKGNIPNHVAVLLDGNGRWAKKKGLPRKYGHQVGAENIMKIARYADQLGIKYLTVYAFSTENWCRPKDEVDYLMTLPLELYKQEKENAEKHKHNIIVKQVGRRSKFSNELIEL